MPFREASDAVKDAVFRGDGSRCCGSTRSLKADHIVPAYLGGSSGIDLLQTLSRFCNAVKAMNELNFRVTRTPLDGPATFAILQLPAQDDPMVDEAWLQHVRRSPNVFYRSSAVDALELHISEFVSEVRLHPGVDVR